MHPSKIKKMVEKNLEQTNPLKEEDQEWVTQEQIQDKLIELGFNVQSKSQMKNIVRKLVEKKILITKKTEEGKTVYGTLL